MTVHVGGPLEADVLLAVDLDTHRVSVSARWSSGGATREARADGLEMTDAETLAAEWADGLGAGHAPDPQ